MIEPLLMCTSQKEPGVTLHHKRNCKVARCRSHLGVLKASPRPKPTSDKSIWLLLCAFSNPNLWDSLKTTQIRLSTPISSQVKQWIRVWFQEILTRVSSTLSIVTSRFPVVLDRRKRVIIRGMDNWECIIWIVVVSMAPLQTCPNSSSPLNLLLKEKIVTMSPTSNPRRESHPKRLKTSYLNQ